MDINMLRTFLAVADYNGLRKAAEYLHLTPSAVSSRIRQLEREIGVQLFERGRKGVVLSDAGERLKLRAEEMIEQWNQLKLDVLQEKESLLSVRLGASDVIWRTWLLPKLHPLAENRDLSLILRTGGREELARMLIEGRLDGVVLPEEIKYPGFYSTKVADLELMPVRSVCSSSETDQYVDIDWGESFRSRLPDQATSYAVPGADINIAWLGLEWLLQMGGRAWLPRSLVQPYLDSGELLAVPETTAISLPVYATFGKENTQVYRILRETLMV